MQKLEKKECFTRKLQEKPMRIVFFLYFSSKMFFFCRIFMHESKKGFNVSRKLVRRNFGCRAVQIW